MKPTPAPRKKKIQEKIPPIAGQENKQDQDNDDEDQGEGIDEEDAIVNITIIQPKWNRPQEFKL